MRNFLVVLNVIALTCTCCGVDSASGGQPLAPLADPAKFFSFSWTEQAPGLPDADGNYCATTHQTTYNGGNIGLVTWGCADSNRQITAIDGNDIISLADTDVSKLKNSLSMVDFSILKNYYISENPSVDTQDVYLSLGSLDTTGNTKFSSYKPADIPDGLDLFLTTANDLGFLKGAGYDR